MVITEKILKELYDDLYPLLYGILYSMVGFDDTKDIIAEVMMKIWTKRDCFEDEEKVKAFACVAARNKALNILRERKYRQQSMLYYELEEIELMTNYYEAESARKQKFTYRRVIRLAAKFPIMCWEIFNLAYVKGYDNKKIADTLRLSIPTVKNQKTIALNKIREKFKIK